MLNITQLQIAIACWMRRAKNLLLNLANYLKKERERRHQEKQR